MYIIFSSVISENDSYNGSGRSFLLAFLWRFERCWFLCHVRSQFGRFSASRESTFIEPNSILVCRIPCKKSNSLIRRVRLCLSGYSEVYGPPESSCLRGVTRTSKMAYLCCWVRSRSYCPRKGYLRWGTLGFA